MAQQLDKIFPCFTCKQNVHLTRNDTNTAWIKTNLDGSEHKHERKQQQNSQTQQKLEQLTSEVAGLAEQVRLLTAQIQMLRSEVKAK